MPLQPLMLQSTGICDFLTLVHNLFLDLQILNLFLGARQWWVSAVLGTIIWSVYAVAPAECRSTIAAMLRNDFLASLRSVAPHLFRGVKSAPWDSRNLSMGKSLGRMKLSEV